MVCSANPGITTYIYITLLLHADVSFLPTPMDQARLMTTAGSGTQSMHCSSLRHHVAPGCGEALAIFRLSVWKIALFKYI